MKSIEGEPAFPNGPHGGSVHYEDGHVEHQYGGCPGMSLRQYYIGQALAGYCASYQYCGSEYGQLAKIAIQQADAVMALLYPQSTKENDANNT